MSNPELPDNKLNEPAEDEPSQGPSLVLLYTLVLLALALAIACAAMIVLPFYRRTTYYKQHETFLSIAKPEMLYTEATTLNSPRPQEAATWHIPGQDTPSLVLP